MVAAILEGNTNERRYSDRPLIAASGLAKIFANVNHFIGPTIRPEDCVGNLDASPSLEVHELLVAGAETRRNVIFIEFMCEKLFHAKRLFFLWCDGGW
jgi:hypothetical protein